MDEKARGRGKGEKQAAWETRGVVMVEKRRGPRAFLCDYTHVRRPDILSAVSEGLLTLSPNAHAAFHMFINVKRERELRC